MSMIMNLLSNNGYIVVNKELIKKFGLNEAVILGEMCSEYAYWSNNHRLENGFFYSTRQNIENNTGLTPYQQREALKTLKQMGILTFKGLGMPKKIWYSLNEWKLYEILLEKNFKTSSEETLYQDVKKLNDKELKNFTSSSEETSCHDAKFLYTNNNNNINKKNNNLISSYLINNIEGGNFFEKFVKEKVEYECLVQDTVDRSAY